MFLFTGTDMDGPLGSGVPGTVSNDSTSLSYIYMSIYLYKSVICIYDVDLNKDMQ